jgi:hypothetical protein
MGVEPARPPQYTVTVLVPEDFLLGYDTQIVHVRAYICTYSFSIVKC